MKCPVDERELLMTDREGIEIDYCPECRGVWLDRGELDKLIERSEQTERSPQSRSDRRDGDHDRDRPHKSEKYEKYDKYEKKKPKKMSGFLSDMFEFG